MTTARAVEEGVTPPAGRPGGHAGQQLSLSDGTPGANSEFIQVAVYFSWRFVAAAESAGGVGPRLLDHLARLPTLPPAGPAPRLRRLKRPRPPEGWADAAVKNIAGDTAGSEGQDERAPASANIGLPAAGAATAAPAGLEVGAVGVDGRCFGGDYKGVTWNAQGFFCAAMASYSEKRRFVQRLLDCNDFVVLTETHGTIGSQKQFEPIRGTEAFWAEGTSARGGVGIIVQNEFLAKFRRRPPEWRRIEAGRLACLRLDGNEGNLDLLAAYFPTGRKRHLAAEVDESGDYDERQDELSLRSQREALARRIRAWLHPDRLTVVAGDFNIVQEREDR